MISHRVHLCEGIFMDLEGSECLLAESVTIDTKTIKHGTRIVPRLLSFDWLELSSAFFLLVGSTQIFLQLALFCLQACINCSPDQPTIVASLLQPSTAATLRHVLCLRGCSRALPRNGRHLLMAPPCRQKKEETMLIFAPLCSPCLAESEVWPQNSYYHQVATVCLITDHTLFEDCVPSGGRSIVQRWTNSQDGCTPQQPNIQSHHSLSHLPTSHLCVCIKYTL